MIKEITLVVMLGFGVVSAQEYRKEPIQQNSLTLLSQIYALDLEISHLENIEGFQIKNCEDSSIIKLKEYVTNESIRKELIEKTRPLQEQECSEFEKYSGIHKRKKQVK